MAKCRFCQNNLNNPFLDLGFQPLCNFYQEASITKSEENKYPLRVFFCEKCFLVQVSHNVSPSLIYDNYKYFSSYSTTWVHHAKVYVEMIVKNLNLTNKSFVVELASNDGYLLKNFKRFNIPCLGIEPSETVAKEAQAKGIETVIDFFDFTLSEQIVKEFGKADLIIANNVYAHVPNINDFTNGIANLLNKNGVITIEVPYLKNLIESSQFDTIYHEHFFYYSLTTLDNILINNGLKIFNVEFLETHGGSLRIYVKHIMNSSIEIEEIIFETKKNESINGMNELEYYQKFEQKVNKIKNNLLELLFNLSRLNKNVAAYGAPGKGNTLLNSCSIDKNLVKFTVDKNPAKQNTLLPGSHIPVYGVEKIVEKRPDYILILPWNLKTEIIKELKFVRDWGGKFIIPIPKLEIIGA